MIKHRNNNYLFEIDDYSFYRKLIILLLLIGIGLLLISVIQGVCNTLGVLVLGLMYAHAVELQHQCLHYTAFNNSKSNKIIGFILGVPMLVSFTHYRINHLRHHCLSARKGNNGFFQSVNDDSRVIILIKAFSLKRYLLVLAAFIKSLMGKPVQKDITKLQAETINFEYKILLICFLTVIALSLKIGVLFVIKCWIIPGLIAEIIHYFIELPEHYQCDLQSNNPFINTRTIVGSKVSFWFTNGNNFHVEHHSMPSIAVDKLPDVHQKINEKLINVNKSYFEFYQNILVSKDQVRTA